MNSILIYVKIIFLDFFKSTNYHAITLMIISKNMKFLINPLPLIINNSRKNNGFSLIELSIVLIILGLLIAGVTGGASLIETAKVQRIINETNSYKQAINVFFAETGKLPGDKNNSGLIGKGSDQVYNDSSFGGNYVSSNKNYGIPNEDCAPFVDLYLKGIITFEPKKIDTSLSLGGNDSNKNGACPYVVGFKSAIYDFEVDKLNKNRNYFRLLNKESPQQIPVKIFKSIDNKIDDGNPTKGSMRAGCSDSEKWTGKASESYDTAKMCIFNRMFYID